MSEGPRRAVVVGAGISGLTAAYTLLRDGPGTDVVVVDADTRTGGKVATTEFAGRPVDAAADAFLARVPEAVDLCHELGLGDQLVTPAVRRAYLFTRGQLRAFPEGLSLGVPTDLDALAAAGVVSGEAVARAALDLELSEPVVTGDESVGSLVRRRVGDEVFETLVAPLLSGVYAGDADQLSVAATAPQFAAALRDHGSLIAGLRAQLEAATRRDAPVFYGLRGGTQQLIDALVHAIEVRGGRIELQREVVAINPVSGVDQSGARVTVDFARGPSVHADAVVLAAPDFVSAGLLRPSVPAVAAELAAVPYASVVLVAVAVHADAIGVPLDGTGFLVPEREGLLLSACSWASTKWSHLAGERVILRASAGRITDERPTQMDDDELLRELLGDLRVSMGLTGTPQEVRINRWPRALPQFAPSHLDRVVRWQREMERDLPGVALAGAGIGGLGLPACIRRGAMAAGQLRSTGRL
jgi:oxygen-dependent protoporphyrinogen oxidase